MVDHKPKILFLVQLPPPFHGVSVINESIRQSDHIKDKFNATYFNISLSKSIADINQWGISKIWTYRKQISDLWRLLKGNDFSLAYITLSPVGGGFLKDSFFILFLKKFKIPIVAHIHGKGVKKSIAKSTFRKIYYNYIFKDIYVIHLAYSLVSDLDDIFSYNKLFVIPNGINIGAVERVRQNDGFKILCLSNLIRSKGALTLVKAFLKFRNLRMESNTKLLLVGVWTDPEFKEEIESFIESNNLTQLVEIPGPKVGRDKVLLFQSASVFVLPTYYPNECFPLVILEAMQMGLPVISTFEGAIPDIIESGKNGLLFEARNVEQLTNHLIRLYDDLDYRMSLGDQASSSYQKNYTFEAFERRLTQTFNEVMESLSNDNY